MSWKCVANPEPTFPHGNERTSRKKTIWETSFEMRKCSREGLEVTEWGTRLEDTSGYQGELENWVCDGKVLMTNRP